MKKRIREGALLFLLVPFLTACAAGNGAGEPCASDFFAMDTRITFTAYGEDAPSVLEDAKERFLELEQRWSVTEEKSEIYAVNHSDGQAIAVSDETAQLLAYALSMAQETEGALDPTIYPVLSAWGFTGEAYRVPAQEEITRLLKRVGYESVHLEKNTVRLEQGMMLDLGAVGKGYAGDVIVDLLREQGVRSAILDIGGNIQTLGTKPDGSDWRLGLKDPFAEGNAGILAVHDLAVITSGTYERYFVGEDGTRYGHILDPASGYPVENDLASVTIVTEKGRYGDALSTALFVMGQARAIEYWRAHSDFDMILITEEGRLCLTEGIEEKFTMDERYRGKTEVLYR